MWINGCYSLVNDYNINITLSNHNISDFSSIKELLPYQCFTYHSRSFISNFIKCSYLHLSFIILFLVHSSSSLSHTDSVQSIIRLISCKPTRSKVFSWRIILANLCDVFLQLFFSEFSFIGFTTRSVMTANTDGKNQSVSHKYFVKKSNRKVIEKNWKE